MAFYMTREERENFYNYLFTAFNYLENTTSQMITSGDSETISDVFADSGAASNLMSATNENVYATQTDNELILNSVSTEIVQETTVQPAYNGYQNSLGYIGNGSESLLANNNALTVQSNNIQSYIPNGNSSDITNMQGTQAMITGNSYSSQALPLNHQNFNESSLMQYPSINASDVATYGSSLSEGQLDYYQNYNTNSYNNNPYGVPVTNQISAVTLQRGVSDNSGGVTATRYYNVTSNTINNNGVSSQVVRQRYMGTNGSEMTASENISYRQLPLSSKSIRKNKKTGGSTRPTVYSRTTPKRLPSSIPTQTQSSSSNNTSNGYYITSDCSGINIIQTTSSNTGNVQNNLNYYDTSFVSPPNRQVTSDWSQSNSSAPPLYQNLPTSQVQDQNQNVSYCLNNNIIDESETINWEARNAAANNNYLKQYGHF